MILLPTPRPGNLIVVASENATQNEMNLLASEIASRGPVLVLDGGGRFRAFKSAQTIYLRTKQTAVPAERLFLRRASTCYEMNTLLKETQALQYPCLVMDLLNTFYDDQISIREAWQTLGSCLDQVDRLRGTSAVIVSLAFPLLQERTFFAETVCRKADELFILNSSPGTAVTQLRLF